MSYPQIENLYEADPELFSKQSERDDDWLEHFHVHTTKNWNETLSQTTQTETKISSEDSLLSDLPHFPVHHWLQDFGRVTPIHEGKADNTDCFGFYLPFHVSPRKHGIYLFDNKLDELVSQLKKLSPKISTNLYRKVAILFTYFHQAFHHRVEMFATRAELIGRKPLYIDAVQEIYQQEANTSHWQEEKLANVSAVIKTCKYLKEEKEKGKCFDLLVALVATQADGYRQAADLLADGYSKAPNKLDHAKHDFYEQIVQEYQVSQKEYRSAVWSFGYVDYPLNKSNGQVNFLVPKGHDVRHTENLNPKLKK